MNRVATFLPSRLPAQPAFVVCALPLFVPAPMLAQVAEVYRLAAERTRQQLAPSRQPARVPAFSRN